MANILLTPDPINGRGDIVAGDPSERKRDKILLGTLTESGPRRRLWLDTSSEQVVAILGKRGTGKSYTLGVLMEGLGAGQGESQIAVLETPRAALMLDIMDIYWTSTIPLAVEGSPEIMRQASLMKLGGFEGMSLNFDVWIPAGFENPGIDPPGVSLLKIQASDLELDDWAALFAVDVFTEPRGMLVAEVVLHVSHQGYTRQDGTVVPANPNFSFGDLIVCLSQDADLMQNYRPDTIRSIRQRMATFAQLPLFTGNSTPLNELLQRFRVSVLMLARVPDELKKVLVAVLVRRILRARRDASFAQKRLDLDSTLSPSDRSDLEDCVNHSIPRTWVMMDEAHVLAGTGEDSVARTALIKCAKEGRNYGISLAVATQQPSALDSRLMSQSESLVLHQLTSPSDTAVAIQSLKSPPPANLQIDGQPNEVDTLLRRLGQGEMVFSSGNAPSLKRMCVAKVRPRVTAHGGYEA
jgi:hypothetical protein